VRRNLGFFEDNNKPNYLHKIWREERRKLTTKNNQKKKDISPFRFSKKKVGRMFKILLSFDDIFVNIAESRFVVEESKKKVILAEENQSFLVMKTSWNKTLKNLVH